MPQDRREGDRTARHRHIRHVECGPIERADPHVDEVHHASRTTDPVYQVPYGTATHQAKRRETKPLRCRCPINHGSEDGEGHDGKAHEDPARVRSDVYPERRPRVVHDPQHEPVPDNPYGDTGRERCDGNLFGDEVEYDHPNPDRPEDRLSIAACHLPLWPCT